MIELNDRVKCTITGFKGVVVAEIKYLNGCKRYQVQSTKLENGKMIDEWIDEEQLALVDKAKPKIKIVKEKDPGGSRDVPSESSHP